MKVTRRFIGEGPEADERFYQALDLILDVEIEGPEEDAHLDQESGRK